MKHTVEKFSDKGAKKSNFSDRMEFRKTSTITKAMKDLDT